jgi:hypothetical protein
VLSTSTWPVLVKTTMVSLPRTKLDTPMSLETWSRAWSRWSSRAAVAWPVALAWEIWLLMLAMVCSA